MTTCTATTAAGHPCKNHAVKGTQLCKACGDVDPIDNWLLAIRTRSPQWTANPRQPKSLLRSGRSPPPARPRTYGPRHIPGSRHGRGGSRTALRYRHHRPRPAPQPPPNPRRPPVSTGRIEDANADFFD